MMKLNTNTWHYWLAEQGSDAVKYHHLGPVRVDFCLYARAIGKMLISALVLIMFALLALWCVADALAWIAACVTTGTLIYPNIPAAVALGLLGFVLVVVILAFGTEYGPKVVPAPALEAYRGWKQKYCPLVEFDE